MDLKRAVIMISGLGYGNVLLNVYAHKRLHCFNFLLPPPAETYLYDFWCIPIWPLGSSRNCCDELQWLTTLFFVSVTLPHVY